MQEETREFVQAVFGASSPWLYHSIWRVKPEKLTEWYRADAVEQCVNSISGREYETTYFGTQPTARPRGPRARVRAADVAEVIAFHCDVDFMAPGESDDRIHKKANLPPSAEAAQALISEACPPPSLLIHSGHGLQGWWLFKQPFVIDDEDDRTQARAGSQAWQTRLRDFAGRYDWEIDATFDLARVLRLPGTYNMKVPSEPKPVTIIEKSAVRYEYEELRELVKDYIEKSSVAKARFTGGGSEIIDLPSGLRLAEQAKMPDKWEMLISIEPRAEAAFNYALSDNPDSSPSSMDMVLANIAAMANWTEQEIVDLLIACRKHNGSDLKLNNPSYYQHTVGKAVQYAIAQGHRDEVDPIEGMRVAPSNVKPFRMKNEDAPPPPTAPAIAAAMDAPAEPEQIAPNDVEDDGVEDPPDEDDDIDEEGLDAEGFRVVDPPDVVERKMAIARNIGPPLRSEIIRVEKLKSDNPYYRLVTKQGTVGLGSSDDVMSQRKMKARIFDLTSEPMQKFSAKEWEEFYPKLIAAAIVIDLGEEATRAGALREYLYDYFGQNPPLEEDEWDETVLITKQPIIKDNCILIFIGHLRDYISRQAGEKLTQQELSQRLRAIGGAPDKLSIKVNGIKQRRNVYRIAQDWNKRKKVS